MTLVGHRSFVVGDQAAGGEKAAHFSAAAFFCSAVSGWLNDHSWPNGSVTFPYRSPQNMSSAGIVTVAPAVAARAMASSALGTHRWMVTGLGPCGARATPPQCSGKSSHSI